MPNKPAKNKKFRRSRNRPTPKASGSGDVVQSDGDTTSASVGGDSGGSDESSKFFGAFRNLLPLLLLCGFVIYLGFFMLQDSTIPDENGELYNRLTILLTVPGSIAAMIGLSLQEFSILDRVPILFGAGLWLTLAWWLGRPFVERALRGEDRVLTHSISILVGLALLSTLTLVLGMGYLLRSRWPLFGAILVAVYFAWKFRPANDTEIVDDESDANVQLTYSVYDRWLFRWLQIGTVVLGACYVLGGLLSPWEFDVVEYHLQAPKEFFLDGGISHVPHNVYANMPLGAEMHSLATMVLIGGSDWFTGALVGKLIVSIFAVLAAFLLFGFLRKRLGNESGWFAVALLLSTAGCIHVSLAGLIDMAVGAYLLATVVVTAILVAKLNSGSASFADVLLLGLLSGAAGACKYPAILLVIIPAVLLCGFVIIWEQRAKPADQGDGQKVDRTVFLLAMSVGLLFTCFPWLIKNTLTTCNPVYPLASSLFVTPDLNETQLENWNRVHSPQSTGSGAGAYSLSALAEAGEQLLWGSTYLNPALVFLTVVGSCSVLYDLCTKRFAMSWHTLSLLFCVWGLAVWWLLTHRIERFWMPLLPLFSLLSIVAVSRVSSAKVALVPLGIALFGVLFGLSQALAGLAPNENRYFANLAGLRAEAGLSQKVAWINENLDVDADRLLCIGDAAAFHYRVPIEYATCFNTNPMESMLKDETSESQKRALEIMGVTHVLVNWLEIDRYRSPGNYGFSDWPQRGDIDGMVESGVLEPMENPFDPNAIQLFKVASSTEES